MIQIYAVIVFIATTIGAIAGLGGGVIIKPLFDFLGFHDAQTVGVLSAFAVFAMSVISLFKHREKLFQLDLNLIIEISVGSFMGGLLGEALFSKVKQVFVQELVLKLIQSSVLMVILILIVIYGIFKHKIKTYSFSHPLIVFLTGLVLGSISVFLGIGGGPLNIIALSVLFSMSVKASVITSITTVFFAQLSKLSQVYIQNQFKGYDYTLILWIIVFALMGGAFGTMLHQKLDERAIEQVYLYTIGFLVIITMINIGTCLIEMI